MFKQSAVKDRLISWGPEGGKQLLRGRTVSGRSGDRAFAETVHAERCTNAVFHIVPGSVAKATKVSCFSEYIRPYSASDYAFYKSNSPSGPMKLEFGFPRKF